MRPNEISKTQDCAIRRLDVNESVDNPATERTGISEALANTLRQPSFLRVMLVLAATVVVLVGIRLYAPDLNPILFAIVLALLFSPVYSWLMRHRQLLHIV